MQDKEDRLVEHDVLALEVRRLRNLLSARADEVFSLKNRKFQLQCSMEERKHEIEVSFDFKDFKAPVTRECLQN